MVAPVFLEMSGIKVVVSRRDMGYWYNVLNFGALRFGSHFLDCVVCNSIAVKTLVQKK